MPVKIQNKHWQALKRQLLYAEKKSAFYNSLFAQLAISASRIDTYAEFQKIPITQKEDLQNFQERFLAIPKGKIVEYVTTSGTTGQPLSFPLNEKDLQRLAENECRSFKIIGVQAGDVVQITTTLDRQFMAGMAYYLGLRKLGATSLRTGSGLPQLQWDSILRFKPKYIIAVPSFLLKMIAFAQEKGIDYKNSSLKAAICIGESLRNQENKPNALAQKIKEKWNIELFSTYASTEMATAFTECAFHNGNHSVPQLIFAEVLDENGNWVEQGETGELVVTPLQTQSMPLLRFATGDMLSYTSGRCKCGREELRLGPVLGRKKQRLKLKGTTLYPQTISEALRLVPYLDNYHIEAYKDSLGNDAVMIRLSLNSSNIDMLKLKDHLKAQLKVVPQIEILKKEEIEKIIFPKTSRKPIFFKDSR